MSTPNKFDMINVVNISTLDAKDKILLVELIMRSNTDTQEAFPGVARLCQTRGIKNAKNFKGVDTYLPGLVTVQKNPGKRNTYFLVPEAIMSLPAAEVNTEKYRSSNPPAVEGYTVPTPVEYPSLEANPPAVEGYYPPAVEGYYPPAVEGYYPPAVEGSNSSVDSSVNSSPNNREMSDLRSTRGNDQGRSLAETNTPLVSSGQDYKEILVEEIGFSPLVKTNVFDDLGREDLSSGKTKSPGYSSVTSKEVEEISSGMAIVNEDDLDKTDEVKKALEEWKAKKAKRSGWEVPSKKAAPSKKSLDVVDASLSASGAVEAPEVQTVPEKPQKPVQHVPERTQWDDDARYESKVHKADMAFTLAMGKWKQDLKVWENKYGNTTNSSDSPSTESTSPTRVFRAQAY